MKKSVYLIVSVIAFSIILFSCKETNKSNVKQGVEKVSTVCNCKGGEDCSCSEGKCKCADEKGCVSKKEGCKTNKEKECASKKKECKSKKGECASKKECTKCSSDNCECKA